jgi:hypothetical protein
MCHKHQSPKNGKHAFIIVSICALIVRKSKNWVMGQTISKLLQEEAKRRSKLEYHCNKKQKEKTNLFNCCKQAK